MADIDDKAPPADRTQLPFPEEVRRQDEELSEAERSRQREEDAEAIDEKAALVDANHGLAR